MKLPTVPTVPTVAVPCTGPLFGVFASSAPASVVARLPELRSAAYAA